MVFALYDYVGVLFPQTSSKGIATILVYDWSQQVGSNVDLAAVRLDGKEALVLEVI